MTIVTVKDRLILVTVFNFVDVVEIVGGVMVDTWVMVTEGIVTVDAGKVVS